MPPARTNERLMDAVRRVCPLNWVPPLPAGPYDADAVAGTLELPPAATVAQRKAALDAVAAFDPSDAAQAAWEVNGASLAAVGLVGTSTDPVFTADRIILRYVCTADNDLRQVVAYLWERENAR